MSRSLSISIGAGAAIAVAGSVALMLASSRVEDPASAILLPLLGGVWIAAGLVAAQRPAAVATAVLMIAAGVAWLLRVLTTSPSPLLVTIGLLFAGFYLAVTAHLLLAFPSGRLERSGTRAFVVAGYVVAVGGQLLRLLVTPAADAGCNDCPEQLLLIAPDHTTANVLQTIQAAAGVALTIAAITILARRYRAARPPGRRVLAPVLVSGGLLVALTSALLVLSALQRETAKHALEWVALAAFAAVPCAFVVGIVRAQVRRGEAYRALASWIERPVRQRDLRRALSEALGDPGLQLAYPLGGADGRYVDESGSPIRLPTPSDGRAWTAIARAGRPIAALIHDAALIEESEHVRAVGATAALALENERLAAELRARIADLSDSRARIVEATEHERRRIERDIHDGAQQRLAALALELGLAIDRLDDDLSDVHVALANARGQAESALRELRALAHGIHPPLLSEQGLAAALCALLDDVPLQTRYVGPDRLVLPATVESALYFVVAEGVANVLKHAEATRIEVRLTATDDIVALEVVDDGIGEGTLGGGLRGLQDRIRALDGQLEFHSPRGAGTALRVRVPCAS